MKRIGIFVVLGFLLSTCGKDVVAPCYLIVNKFTVLKNPDATVPQGSLNNNFSDAWIYIDGNLMGVFELPLKLPFNSSGSKKLTVIAGIRNNGIEATKLRYPFVENYETTINLSPDEPAVVNPTTQYYSDLNFWIEDFEDPATLSLTETLYTKTHLQASNDPTIIQTFNDNYFGRVDLTTADSVWDVFTSDHLAIAAGRTVFLEIDYYNTASLLTGLIDVNVPGQTSANNADILLNPQDPSTIHWKKIYIELSELIGYEVDATYFQIALTSLLDVANYSSGFLCIDNIKVIYN